MKVNLPVTGREIELNASTTILSTTNKKGQITYINQEFIDISGFSEEELAGKSHNIVRHPDMPSMAFDDLWKTIKSGKSWMGIVKNRCKNGDHYWVNAFVTPIVINGEINEYQSVRTKASPQDIARAENLYKKLNKGKLPLVLRLPKLSFFHKLSVLSFFCILPLMGLLFFKSTLAWYWSTLAVMSSLLILSGGIKYFLRHLNEATINIQNICNNDLVQYVYTGTRDEIGAIVFATKSLHAQTKAVTGRINDNTQHLVETAIDLSNSVALTNQGITHQRNEAQKLENAMKEMLITSTNVSRDAQEASQAAVDAGTSSNAGKSVIFDVIDSINTIAEQVEKTTMVIRQLADDTDDIGAILDVIKNIAGQTNLLALNAAIEAARAGEQGRGFAVVADEVRTLASRTQGSTQEIEEVIQKLQYTAQNAVESMEGGRELARESATNVGVAGEALNNITAAIDRIKAMNTQIASAAEQQSSVTQEVKSNVESIDEASELTVETLQGFNHINQKMDTISHTMAQLAAHFNR